VWLKICLDKIYKSKAKLINEAQKKNKRNRNYGVYFHDKNVMITGKKKTK